MGRERLQKRGVGRGGAEGEVGKSLLREVRRLGWGGSSLELKSFNGRIEEGEIEGKGRRNV